MTVRAERKLVGVQRSLVLDRSKGRCERCGKTLGATWECHHRKLRSQGGTWSLANLLALHPDCHNPGAPGSVHREPTESYRLGYLVRSATEPNAAPVFLFRRRWVLLSPCSPTYLETEPPL